MRVKRYNTSENDIAEETSSYAISYTGLRRGVVVSIRKEEAV
jgi:hypothetical protein